VKKQELIAEAANAHDVILSCTENLIAKLSSMTT
jgi:hypothetical protein